MAPTVSPPLILPPLLATSCPPASSPLWRGPTSVSTLDVLRYTGARRLSCPQVYTLLPRSTSSSKLPKPAVLGKPSVGPRRFCPPSLVRLMGEGGGACSPRGTWHAPSGRHCVRNPESCNGLSYAWGPIRRYFQRDGNPSPDFSPSGTEPPSPTGSCSTSSRPVTMSSDAGGSAPTYLPNSPLLSTPRYLLPSGIPPAPLG